MSEKTLQIVCDCGSPEHQMSMWYDEQEPDFVCLEFHLAHKPFFQRIKHALKYVLGHKSRYGCFDETLITQKSAVAIATFLYDFVFFASGGQRGDIKIVERRVSRDDGA